MANSYYTHLTWPITSSTGSSQNARDEMTTIEQGFDAVETAMNLKAPLADPVLTGDPTTVTPSPGDDSHSIADTAFVHQEVVDIGLPSQAGHTGEYLSTDGSDMSWEIAVTLNGVQTLTNKTITDADLQGDSTAITQAGSDNTTLIATTAFVLGQASGASPLMAGTVAVGTSYKYSREDHRHPSDTDKADLHSPVFTGDPTCPSPPLGLGTASIINAWWYQSQASSLMPEPSGTGTAGTSYNFSREDHVHPAGNSLPDQSGHSGQFLQTNGTVADWAEAATSDNTLTLTNKTLGDGTVFTDGALEALHATALYF